MHALACHVLILHAKHAHDHGSKSGLEQAVQQPVTKQI